jgi:hypothetical protein
MRAHGRRIGTVLVAAVVFLIGVGAPGPVQSAGKGKKPAKAARVPKWAKVETGQRGDVAWTDVCVYPTPDSIVCAFRDDGGENVRIILGVTDADTSGWRYSDTVSAGLWFKGDFMPAMRDYDVAEKALYTLHGIEYKGVKFWMPHAMFKLSKRMLFTYYFMSFKLDPSMTSYAVKRLAKPGK